MGRLLLGAQIACAGEAWSCTSPHADVTQVAIQRRPCRLLLPMPTLLTACTWGTSSVTCRPRWGATPAEKQGNRRLGRLPMRNGSRQGRAQPCESANSCICNIRHTAPGDERLLFPATFCGILSQRNFTRRKAKKFKGFINTRLLQHHPCHLCYDERTQMHGGSAPGREETGWTLSRSWIKSLPSCASAVA